MGDNVFLQATAGVTGGRFAATTMAEQLTRDRLLAALADLPADRERALSALPALLSRYGQAQVTVVTHHAGGELTLAASNDPKLEGVQVMPADGIIALAAARGHPIYLTAAPAHPNHRRLTDHGHPVEFAIPVFERDSVTAVLNIERDRPYTLEERRALESLADGLTRQFTQLSHGTEARMISALSERFVEMPNGAEAGRIALEVIAASLDAEAAVFLAEQRGRMRAVAHVGRSKAANFLELGTPYPHGFAWHAVLSGQTQFTRDYGQHPLSLMDLRAHVGPVVLVLPLGSSGQYGAALAVHFGADVHVSEADIVMMEGVSRHLALVFSAIHATSVQNHLLELHASILQEGERDLYQQVLEAAINHVPGAEAGSLLIRDGESLNFKYVAASGFDLEALKRTEYSERHMREWYAGDESDWGGGRARVLTAADVNLEAFSREASDQRVPFTAGGGLHELQATACLPVAFQGEVLAVINLDNFTRREAFGPAALRTLKQFGLPLATLLASVQLRSDLLAASRLDPLTRIANRNALHEQLEQQHARSSRTGEPYSLLMMDLRGFKAVNDTYGHATGDEVLERVAAVLGETARAGDTVARWGGDEFVALLANSLPEDATSATARFAQAVAGLALPAGSIELDIGAAHYPADSTVMGELLLIADARMYAQKNQGRGLTGAGEPPLSD